VAGGGKKNDKTTGASGSVVNQLTTGPG